MENNTTLTMVQPEVLKQIQADLTELKELIRNKAKEEASAGWVDSVEARKLLGVSPKTWQTYRDQRIIPFSQFGRKIMVRRADIEAFLQSHTI